MPHLTKPARERAANAAWAGSTCDVGSAMVLMDLFEKMQGLTQCCSVPIVSEYLKSCGSSNLPTKGSCSAGLPRYRKVLDHRETERVCYFSRQR